MTRSRPERGIGLAIRKGQEEGRFLVPGQTVRRPGPDHAGRDATSMAAGRYFDSGDQRQDTYAMTDGVPDGQFEGAIEEAETVTMLPMGNTADDPRLAHDLPRPTDFRSATTRGVEPVERPEDDARAAASR